jgi:hypothetical protein
LTTADVPKHLLPVAGVPAIVRLLDAEGPLSAFPQIVVAVAADDTQTLLTLVGQHSAKDETEPSRSSRSSGIATLQSEQDDSRWTLTSNNVQGQAIDLVKLSEDCFGPIDALRQIEIMNIVHPETRMVVFPGDLVILNDDKKIERYMLDALIRPPSDSAIVAMLVDVLEQDEHGHTLKESAKVSSSRSNRQSLLSHDFLAFYTTYLFQNFLTGKKRWLVTRRRRYRVHCSGISLRKLDREYVCQQ